MAICARAVGTFLILVAATAALVVAIGFLNPAPGEPEEWFTAGGAAATKPENPFASAHGLSSSAAPPRLTFEGFSDKDSPEPGSWAPNFSLRAADGTGTVRLQDFQDKSPVALIFGSFT